MTTPLISREAWGARPAEGRPTNIAPEGLTIHYGGRSPWPSPIAKAADHDHGRCAAILRAWQDYHMSPGWSGTADGAVDLAYSSAVCPGGFRFEGRGPGVRTAANGTNAGNLRSYATVYIAGDRDVLTPEAVEAYHDEADRFGEPLRWGHRDWLQTGCPGTLLWAWRQAGFPQPEEDDLPLTETDLDKVEARVREVLADWTPPSTVVIDDDDAHPFEVFAGGAWAIASVVAQNFRVGWLKADGTMETPATDHTSKRRIRGGAGAGKDGIVVQRLTGTAPYTVQLYNLTENP